MTHSLNSSAAWSKSRTLRRFQKNHQTPTRVVKGKPTTTVANLAHGCSGGTAMIAATTTANTETTAEATTAFRGDRSAHHLSEYVGLPYRDHRSARRDSLAPFRWKRGRL